MKNITNEQSEFIINNYYSMSNREICEKLNIDRKYLKSFASRMGLKKDYFANDGRYVSKEQIEYIKKYYPTEQTIVELSKNTGLSTGLVKSVLDRYNIKKKSPILFRNSGILTKEQKKYIYENYETMRTNDMCRAIGVDYNLVRSFANNHNLSKNVNSSKSFNGAFDEYLNKRRNNEYNLFEHIDKLTEPKVPQDELYKSKYGKYYINQNYFKHIDNEWKAYWLGFLYADGCVVANDTTIALGLATIDKGHIQKLLDSVQSDSPIRDYVTKQGYASSKCSLCNSKIYEDLIDKGCVPRKSLILKPPTNSQVPQDLIRHFIRGYFDGDGCIHINMEKKIVRFSILGTKELLEFIGENIKTFCDIDYYSITLKNNIYTLSVSGISNIGKIYNYLYNDCNIYLDRKLKKFDTLYCLG